MLYSVSIVFLLPPLDYKHLEGKDCALYSPTVPVFSMMFREVNGFLSE